MKVVAVATSVALVLGAGGASAQSVDRAEPSRFEGLKIGGTVDHRRHEGKYEVATAKQRIDAQEGGFGYRGFIGVDAAVGTSLIVGAEAGIGNGGNSLKGQGAAGSYTLDPKWSWDVSGRVGVTPSRNILLYARAGYNWLRTQETLVNIPANPNDFDRKRTRGGLLWGIGAEFALTHEVALRTEFNQTNFRNGLKAARLQFGGVLRF